MRRGSALSPRMANIDIQPDPVISRDTTPAVALTFLVNFGIFAGRDVSRLELERLGHLLLRIVDGVTLVSEHRLELAEASSIALHQVRVAVARAELPSDEPDIEARRARVAAVVQDW